MKMICLRASKHYIFTREQLESLGARAYMQVLSFTIFIVWQLVCISLRFKLILASERESLAGPALFSQSRWGVWVFRNFCFCNLSRAEKLDIGFFCGWLVIFVKLALFELSGIRTISQLRSPKNLLLNLYVKHVRYLATSERTWTSEIVLFFYW